MLNHDYLAQSLRRPLPTKDGGTLRTVADAANYIVALPEDRRRTHWDRTVQLLLDMADPSEISRQLELALFYDSSKTGVHERSDKAGEAPTMLRGHSSRNFSPAPTR